MINRQGFAALLPVIILLVVGVTLVIVVLAIRANSSQSFLSKASEESKPEVIPIIPKKSSPSAIATKSATPSTDITPPPPSSEPESPITTEPKHTTPGWSYSGTGGIDVTVTPNSAGNILYIDFEADNFNNVKSITYLLTYDATSSGPARGVQGTITNPGLLTPTGDYDSRPYLRRSVTLGTCSQKACTYDVAPQNFNLTVTTNYFSKVTLTRILETLYLP